MEQASSHINNSSSACENNCSAMYAYLASYNNNCPNAPITIPPPFYQVSHPQLPPKTKIPKSLNYKAFYNAYPKSYVKPSELKLNYCKYPRKGWPMDNPGLQN